MLAQRNDQEVGREYRFPPLKKPRTGHPVPEWVRRDKNRSVFRYRTAGGEGWATRLGQPPAGIDLSPKVQLGQVAPPQNDFANYGAAAAFALGRAIASISCAICSSRPPS